MLDLKELLLYLSVLTSVIALITTIWTLVTSGARKNAATIEAHARRLETIEGRLQSVEQSVRGMPGKDDIHAVQIALSEMRGELRAVHVTINGTREIMGRLEAVVTRHEEHLLGSRT